MSGRLSGLHPLHLQCFEGMTVALTCADEVIEQKRCLLQCTSLFLAHNEIVLQRKTRSLSGRDGHRLTRCRLEPVANDPKLQCV
jgi:hypothetical protein